jgi:hypothetical protein
MKFIDSVMILIAIFNVNSLFLNWLLDHVYDLSLYGAALILLPSIKPFCDFLGKSRIVYYSD